MPKTIRDIRWQKRCKTLQVLNSMTRGIKWEAELTQPDNAEAILQIRAQATNAADPKWHVGIDCRIDNFNPDIRADLSNIAYAIVNQIAMYEYLQPEIERLRGNPVKRTR